MVGLRITLGPGSALSLRYARDLFLTCGILHKLLSNTAIYEP